MAFEFDHLFICTEPGAQAAERLIAFGLVEGTPNTHPGQGTRNRRFFFHNAMLELLWVYSPEEVQSPCIQPTRLWDRWSNREESACPFGICLRSAPSQNPPFSHWAYYPPYLPEAVSIAVGTNSDRLTEPMLFQIPFGQRPDHYPVERAQPLKHRTGFREITRVELISPMANDASPELQAVMDTKQIKLRASEEYWVELGFDGEALGQRADFRPHLRLILSW